MFGVFPRPVSACERQPAPGIDIAKMGPKKALDSPCVPLIRPRKLLCREAWYLCDAESREGAMDTVQDLRPRLGVVGVGNMNLIHFTHWCIFSLDIARLCSGVQVCR